MRVSEPTIRMLSARVKLLTLYQAISEPYVDLALVEDTKRDENVMCFDGMDCPE